MKKIAAAFAVTAAMLAIAWMAWWLWPPAPMGSPPVQVNPSQPAPAPDATPSLTPELEGDPAEGPSLSVDGATLTPEEFTSLTEQTLGDLPTTNDLHGMSEEEAHDYPEALARAGGPLGQIAQAVHDQPALRSQATKFYADCASAESVVIPVRALCYSHVLGDAHAPTPESLPPEVVRLAKLIPAE